MKKFIAFWFTGILVFGGFVGVNVGSADPNDGPVTPQSVTTPVELDTSKCIVNYKCTESIEEI